MPLAAGAAIWLLPHAGFAAPAWGLLCLLAATIVALITRPLAAGAVVIVALTAGSLLRLFTIQEALSGYANVTVWLIVTAFMFARGFAQSHLGERIAYLIVRRIGGSPLGLGYAIVCADLVMAPMTPSNTARAGGILFPITLNVARAFGSEPGPTAARIGQFLMLALFHGDLIVSAMFLTATAPNPLVAELARQGAGIEVSWTQWAIAAALPGVASLALVPWAIFRLCPPALHETHAAQALAAERLAAMGPLARREWIMLIVFGLVLALWLTGDWHGVPATSVALLGVSLLLLTRVLEWQDLVEEKGAWDAFIWFGGLVTLAAQLERAGLPRAFAGAAASAVGGWEWWWALVDAPRHLSVRALRLRQPRGARDRDVSRVSRRGDRPRRAAARRRARFRLLLQPQRGDDALRNRPGADRVRRRLRDAGGMVAHRFCDLPAASRGMVAARLPLVETPRPVVNR